MHLKHFKGTGENSVVPTKFESMHFLNKKPTKGIAQDTANRPVTRSMTKQASEHTEPLDSN